MKPLEKIELVKSIVEMFESKKLIDSPEKFRVLMAVVAALYQDGDPYKIDIRRVE